MKIKTIETFAVAFLLSVSLNTAQAQKAATDKAPAKKAAGKQTDRRADRPTRESIIKRFDKDGDGKLSDAERAAARKEKPKANTVTQQQNTQPASQAAPAFI